MIGVKHSGNELKNLITIHAKPKRSKVHHLSSKIQIYGIYCRWGWGPIKWSDKITESGATLFMVNVGNCFFHMLKMLTFQGQIQDFLNGVANFIDRGADLLFSNLFYRVLQKIEKNWMGSGGGGRLSVFLALVGSVIGNVARWKYQGRICGEWFESVKTKSRQVDIYSSQL